MGWLRDGAPDHEGYIVGLAEPGAPWRELGYPEDRAPRAIRLFRVACECGWRSRVYHAPPGAKYTPYSAELYDAHAEHNAMRLWDRHVDDETHLHPVRK